MQKAGYATGAIGLLILAYLAFIKIFEGALLRDRPILWLGIMLVILGVQFLFFGLLAEMQMRTYYESQGKSIYVVREIIQSANQQVGKSASGELAQPCAAAAPIPAALAGVASTGNFQLPPRVAELVRGGMELGEADDAVFGRTNSKQNEGAVGILTHGRLTRAAFYAPAVLLALVKFLNPAHYEQ